MTRDKKSNKAAAPEPPNPESTPNEYSSREEDQQGTMWHTMKTHAKEIIAAAILVALAIVALTAWSYLLKKFEDAKQYAAGVISDTFSNDKTYIVLAVFPDTSLSSSMVEALGFQEGSVNRIPLARDSALDNVKLEFFRENPSLDSTKRKLNRRLEEDPRVLMVIGHERSTTVQELLPTVYRKDPKNPIPLVLPAATTPELTEVPEPGMRHVLRLPANDERQVAALYNLLSRTQNRNSKRVLLLGDNGNRAYSSFIVKEILAQGRNLPIVDAQGIDLFSTGFSPHRLLAASPTTIVLAGMELKAALLVQRLKEEGHFLNLDKLMIVFTDGAAGRHLQESLAEFLTPGEKVFLTGPFVTSAEKGELTPFPTYGRFAAAAKLVAATLVRRADGRLTRKNIRRQLQNMADEDSTLDFNAIRVRFDEEGENSLSVFHLYELTNANVFHSEYCSC